MKCPDCGEHLHEMSLTGTDRSYRCFRCGGFWVDGWVVNQLPAKLLEKWKPINVDAGWLTLGNGTCPVDATVLMRYSGASVPANIVIKKCDRCGRWWFPSDSLLTYKPAVEAKLNYFKLWGMTADVASLALPVLGMVIVILGTVMGVRLVRLHNEASIQAEGVVTGFGVTKLDETRALVNFSSGAVIDTVEVAGQTYIPERAGSVYILRLANLQADREYSVKVWKKEYKFKFE